MFTRFSSLLALALIASACSESLPFEPAGPDAAPDPSTFGPYAVGVRTVTLVDETREYAGKPREIVTEIWYPAVEEARGGVGVTYDITTLLTDEQQAIAATMEIPVLETIAVRDAKLWGGEEKFPLIVFSHGQGGIRWQSTYYTVLLASHGYVVVAPDHPGNTLDKLLRDELTSTVDGIVQRPQDTSFLIDVFTGLPKDHFLSGRIDNDLIGVTGHSFGAITSFRTAMFDDRVKAIVPQTPGFTRIALVERGDKPLEIPMLIQAAKEDKTLPWEENVPDSWSYAGGPHVFFDLVRGGHFTYSDLCQFDLETLANEIGMEEGAEVIGDGCGENAIKAEAALPLINQFAVGFFNGVLRKSPASFDYLTQAKADAKAPGEAEVKVDLGSLK